MKTIKEIIIVEGRYDSAAVKRAVNGTVLETGGFSVFSDQDKVRLIRRLGADRGVILLTDSDGAGKVIRSHLKGMLPELSIRQAYIPQRPGKEKRKSKPSREGLLGVEAMEPDTIVRALERCGASFLGEEEIQISPWLTKAKMYQFHLSGREDSAEKRRMLCRKLDLPENLTANALMEVLNSISSEEEILVVLQEDFVETCDR